MGSRRKGREAALQMLYQMETSGVGADQAIALYWANLGAGGAPEPEPAEPRGGQPGASEEFANRIVRGVETERAQIDDLIRGVSQHWRLERMTRVDRNILRLGCFELLHVTDVPRRVTLNEAVELAKRYGSDGSAGFVNGVLDRIASDLGKE